MLDQCIISQKLDIEHFSKMAVLPSDFVQFPIIMITTLGLFELNVVYSPRSNSFHLTSLGNSQEAKSKWILGADQLEFCSYVYRCCQI